MTRPLWLGRAAVVLVLVAGATGCGNSFQEQPAESALERYVVAAEAICERHRRVTMELEPAVLPNLGEEIAQTHRAVAAVTADIQQIPLPPDADGQRIRDSFLTPIQEMNEFYAESERQYREAETIGDPEKMAAIYEEFDNYAFGPRQRQALAEQAELGLKSCAGQ